MVLAFSMAILPLSDISFDDQDANLFLVDDVRLRADALKQSILPRLSVVLNSAIALIREVYGIEALDDSIISVFPNFRQKRDRELKILYESAFVGLGGQRKAKWPGFSRQDGKPVQILPFRLAFELRIDGVSMVLENAWLKGLSDQSFEEILQFHVQHEHKINPLCFESCMRPHHFWAEDLPILSTFRHQYRYRIHHGEFDNHFIGHNYHFPVAGVQLEELVRSFATFFPIYDSYIQMAKGFPHRLDALIAKLNNWFQQEQEESKDEKRLEDFESKKESALAAASTEFKIRVMPSIRWQVFQRDQWKCVACGRNSHDGVILHVDHIQPRSFGGLDVLDNYQTLCNICNIGKGNRDATDLRNKG